MSDKNILVIDDSSTNVVLLNAVLAQHGYEVISALNAHEAYKLIDKHKPDLILLDLLMPEISGFDFLENIKKDQSLKDIPVVIVSAVGTKENIRQTKKMGAVHFISKPVNVNELLNTVSLLLS
ncbi:MAG: response regulator [Bacteroidales bacterium]|nr:response regulator [Bacteroidales bacterium]